MAKPPTAGTAVSMPTNVGTRSTEEDEGEPAWPPNEAAGPSAGLGAGPAAGAAGWAGDGTADDAVALAAVGVDGGGAVVGDVTPSAGLVTAL